MATQEQKLALETVVNELREAQNGLQTLANSRNTLQTQMHENEMVNAEFKLLEEDASVFKLVGPVLVKQDLQEARANIQKRMEFIKIEITRLDNQFKEKEKLVKSRRDTVMQMQAAMQGGGAAPQ